MKASVYVTDDLWEQALRTAGTKMKPSELVQEAVKSYVEQASKPQLRLIVSQPETSDLFKAALDAVRGGYEKDYRAGYELVLRLVRDLGFDLMRVYEASAFDLVATLQGLEDGEHVMIDLETSRSVELRAPDALSNIGFVWEMLNDPLHAASRRGGARAMQDLWDALHSSDPTVIERDEDAAARTKEEQDET